MLPDFCACMIGATRRTGRMTFHTEPPYPLAVYQAVFPSLFPKPKAPKK